MLQAHRPLVPQGVRPKLKIYTCKSHCGIIGAKMQVYFSVFSRVDHGSGP